MLVNNTPTSLGRGADDPPINEDLLFALARARAHGTPQWKIAARVGISPSLLTFWVQGQRLPSRTQAEQVAIVLGYSVDQLFSRLRKAGEPDEILEKTSSPVATPGSTKLSDAGAHHEQYRA